MLRHGRSEYLVLRRTIAQRGALRHIFCICGTGIWAVTLTAVLAWLQYPLGVLIPLLTLAAAFEAIRPLHFGAERIGRYLQVFYEEAGHPERALLDTPSWERVAMQFGTVPGVGGHPLFLPVFLLAAGLNFLAAWSLGPMPAELIALAVLHAAFTGRLLTAHRAMKSQREIELTRLRQLAGK